MSKRKKRRKPPAPQNFAVGDRVRVKHGVKDTDYSDMSLGGWAGTISEVQEDGSVTVRWSRKTLDAIHPVFKKRCEKDGLELEEYWLGEADLELDTGGPLTIEHPKKIETKPLSPKDQDDRVRMVFALTSNDPLPDADEETLLKYHAYLSKNMCFPFQAEHGAEYGHPARIKVIGLGDPDDEPMIDEMYGILCDVRLEGEIVTVPLGEIEDAKGKPNRQLVADYSYWFWNWR